jgi:hypothetical protein
LLNDTNKDGRRWRYDNGRQKRYYLSNKGSISAAFQNKRDSIKSCEKWWESLEEGINEKRKTTLAVGVLNIELESAPQIPDIEQRGGRNSKRIFTLESSEDKVSNFVPENTIRTSFAALDVIF